MAEDLRLEEGQRWGGLQSQLVAELVAEPAVLRVTPPDAGRTGTARAVLGPEPLPQRPIGDAPVQHVDRADVIAERQPGIHENLERTLQHLVDAGSLGRQRQLVGELGEGRTAPPFQGLTDEISGSSRVGCERRAGLVHSPFEPHGVDIVGVDRQHVATGSGCSGAAPPPRSLRIATRSSAPC